MYVNALKLKIVLL